MSDAPFVPVHLIVLGGFRGAVKTATILRLAQHCVAKGKRVGIVTNDHAADLVDSEIFRSANLDALEVAGGCFCCRFDDFISASRRLSAVAYSTMASRHM
jgi:G3E family GTPase